MGTSTLRRPPLWVWWVLALALGALLLLPGGAHAQGFGGVFPGGGGGGAASLDPARADSATSYTATGPNGVKTTPQASPASFGACAALAGAYASATPTGELAPSPYFCNGVAWRRVWTDADGVVANADVLVPGFTFISNAPDGAIGFQANSRSVWRIGPGTNSTLVDLGGSIGTGSLVVASGQSVKTDTLANTTAAASINVSTARYLRLIQSSLPSCTTNDSGGLVSASGDSNRLYQCDGTAVYRVSRVVVVPVTFDFPNVPNGSCVVSSVTVAGAVANDTLSVVADFALPADVMVGQVRGTGANTVELKLCNVNPSSSQDPASGSYRFRLER